MDMINVRVRKEVVQCSKCKKPKDYIYLSDFSYGERIVFSDNGIACAFTSLTEDKIYDEYEELVRKVLQEHSLEIGQDKVNKFIIETLGITCDEINGCKVDFSQNQKKCCFCGSTDFDRNMIEPESLIIIEIPLISHQKWINMDYEKKHELVKNEVMLKM